MLFKLTSDKTRRETHCGVLEFVADEGKVYLPYWVNKLQEAFYVSSVVPSYRELAYYMYCMNVQHEQCFKDQVKDARLFA